MKAPQPTYTRKLPPAGTHMARLIGLISIGTVKSSFEGKEKEGYKIRLTWELPNETTVFKEGEQEKPFVVSKELGFSMHKKSSLRPIVEGMIGTALSDEEAYAFDMDDLIGMPCILSIVIDESDKGKYVAIKSASSLMKGTTCPDQINKTQVLSFEKWDEKYFETLPSFIKDKIMSSKEYKVMKGIKVEESTEVDEDEIPF